MFKAPFFIEGIKNIFKKPITEEGSIEKVKAADNYRGRLSFNEDACIGCGLCLRVCAGNAITKSIKPVEGGQEITMTLIWHLVPFVVCVRISVAKKP